MRKIEMLEKLSGYGVVAYDLRLFLDVNPNNRKAQEDFNRVTDEYRALIADFENKYGPLTGGNDSDGSWTNDPWPWHRDFV